MKELLRNKVAVIYGAGSIGGTVAQAFAREGAKVYLAAQSQKNMGKVANKIIQANGFVETTVVEALDKRSVDAFVDAVFEKNGRIDISFCATNVPAGGEQGSALSEITYEDFALPITHYTKAQFITANSAARHMTKQGSGVIMMITSLPSRIPIPFSAGFGPAWAAMEALSRTLAAELGQYGVRTVCLHSAGSPESLEESISKTFSKNPYVEQRMKDWKFPGRNLINKWPTLELVGNMAAFMASDYAGVTTSATANLTGGMTDI